MYKLVDIPGSSVKVYSSRSDAQYCINCGQMLERPDRISISGRPKSYFSFQRSRDGFLIVSQDAKNFLEKYTDRQFLFYRISRNFYFAEIVNVVQLSLKSTLDVECYQVCNECNRCCVALIGPLLQGGFEFLSTNHLGSTSIFSTAERFGSAPSMIPMIFCGAEIGKLINKEYSDFSLKSASVSFVTA